MHPPSSDPIQTPTTDEAGFGLPQALALVRRCLPWTAVGAVAGLLLAVVVAVLPAKPSYRATSVLLIGDPEGPGPTGGRVPILPMDGYLRLLMSRPVLQAANHAVAARAAKDEPAIDSEQLSARPVEVRRGEFGTTAMIELSAEHPSPELAAAYVNAWAHALVATEAASALRAALQRVLFDIGGERLKLRDRRVWLEARITGAERELPGIPRTIPIRSRVEDPFLIGGSKEGAARGETIDTQELNPIYIEMSSKLNENRLELSTVRRALEVLDQDEAAVLGALAQLDEMKQIAVPPAGTERTLRAGSLEAALGGAVRPSANPLLARVLGLRGAVSVMREAEVPARPADGRAGLKTLLGCLGGAILGALAALLREGMRRAA